MALELNTGGSSRDEEKRLNVTKSPCAIKAFSGNGRAGDRAVLCQRLCAAV